MIQSHLLGAVVLGLLLSHARRFAPRDWALALAFAVAIDVDHLIQVPAYVITHGVSDLTPATIMHWGGAWQGFLHTPWALLVVLPAMFIWRSWIPLAFWGLHMFQDFVIATKFVHFGSAVELWIDVGLVAVAAALFWFDHRTHAPARNYGRHVAATFGLVK